MNNQTNDLKIEHFFELKQEDKYYKVFILNQEDVTKLFATQKFISINNDIILNNSLKAYKSEDGKVLVMRPGEDEFPLYPSEHVLIKQLEAYDPKPKSIFEGVNIYGESFPEKAPILSKQLLQKCGVTSFESDNIEILKQVDNYISNNRTLRFINENFLYLVALVGELVNRSYGSNWLMLHSNHWVPVLSKGNQQIYFADFILNNYENKNDKNPILNSYESVIAIIQFNSTKASKLDFSSGAPTSAGL